MSVTPSPSATLYDPAPLEEMANQVRSQVIPWEAYQRGRMITQEQLDLIRAYDKKDPYVMDSLLERHGKTYVKLFLDLLKGLSKDNTVQYVLTMIDDMLTANSERIKLFHSREHDGYPFTALLKCLDRDDEYIMQKANKILTGIICSGASISNDDFRHYLDWIVNKLKSANLVQLETAIQSLMNLLMVVEIRLKFAATLEGIQRLVDNLKKAPNFQIRYQVTFCIWLLTFTKEIAAQMNTKYFVIPVLVENIKSSLKEKVIRVSIATIRNLFEKAPEINSQPLSDHKVLSLCQSLLTRKWTDEDIVSDLEFLVENLVQATMEPGSFDEYASEVRSGKLEWGPSHRSESFWKQNAENMNKRDYELIKILARLLSTSSNPTVLSVACHDLGEYVRVYPRGKKILQQVGAKQSIMELMSHSEPEVRSNALVSIQKFMVTNWEYLSKNDDDKRGNK